MSKGALFPEVRWCRFFIGKLKKRGHIRRGNFRGASCAIKRGERRGRAQEEKAID